MASLRRAEPADRELLRALLADYLYELVGATEPYRYFDAYWTEPERLPFLIEADGEVAGLCLVRFLGDCWHIAEFSVLPERRRTGVGRAAVEDLAGLARAAGGSHLEASVYKHNEGGLAFWPAVGFDIVRDEDEKVVTRRDV